jgi:pantoate--beta-alanine ligase
MEILRSKEALRHWRKNQGYPVGFVPTMGYLHDGHLALADAIRTVAPSAVLIASIYVNPTQFGANEDLDAYPSDFEGDVAKLAQRGVTAVFVPSDTDMYPTGKDKETVAIVNETLTSQLCGASRPVHFGGVQKVVAKLFNLVQPDLAAFGEKDFQQIRAIETMVEELCFPVQIVRGATVRESDGLAMSSRNAYLTESERQVAPLLQQTMQATRTALQAGTSFEQALQASQDQLNDAGFKVDYFECREARTLQPITEYNPNIEQRLFAAAKLGATRLIDNIAL